MKNSLNSLLKDASDIISSEFNLKLEKSQLKIYPDDKWNEFCNINKFDSNSEGLYAPKSFLAYVKTDTPLQITNIFHEYFGHGLFCEHSQIGKKLVEIIQNNGNGNSFLYDEINSIQQPLGICRQNIENYEGFALWTEEFLCQKTGYSKIWNLKMDTLPDYYLQLFELFKHKEEEMTRFGFISQLGFPKFYDNETLLNTIKKGYDKNFKNIDFIMLYGSQKPESDIDLFIITTNPSKNYFNGWLDIYELNREEFNELIYKLDISVTDPLFSGELIHGDKNNLDTIKNKIKEITITKEAIEHNLTQSKIQKENLDRYENDEKNRKDCLSYIDSFLKNSEQLRLGNKLLTYQKLSKNIY